MIDIKVEKRDNGTIASVLSQGHSSAQVRLAVDTIMKASGHYLEANKAGIMEITEKEMCLVSGIKQTKQAMAVVDTLLNGLEALAQQFPYCLQVQYLWAEK